MRRSHLGHHDGFGRKVSYQYDENGNRTALVYPGGNTVWYGYDPLNRMTGFTNWLGGVTTYGYDNRGNVVTTTNANGTTVAYAYDTANRLIGLTNTLPDGKNLASYNLVLDPIGNHLRATIEQPLLPILQTQTNIYKYDEDNRLLSVDADAVTHDANGNLTSWGAQTFQYDFENRLIAYSHTNVDLAFAYDGLGNRLTSFGATGQTGPVTRDYVLDRAAPLTQVLVEVDDTMPSAYYVYGLGLTQRITPAQNTLTYHFDTCESTIALTDSLCLISHAYAYDSFGLVCKALEATSQPYRYLGHAGVVSDNDCFYYARARYFSPSLGRFLTKDSLACLAARSEARSLYVYANNNPFRFHDVSGLTASEFSPAHISVSTSTSFMLAQLKPFLTSSVTYISAAPRLTPQQEQDNAALIRGYEALSSFLARSFDRIALESLALVPEIGVMLAAAAEPLANETHWPQTRDRLASNLSWSLTKTDTGRAFLRDVGNGHVLAISIEQLTSRVEDELSRVGASPELLDLMFSGH